jgi:ATP-dependent Clp protease ATP-binding subunit ClpC
MLSRRMIENRNSDEESFIRALDQGLEHDEDSYKGPQPKRLVASAVSDRVRNMLEDAQRFATSCGGVKINEPALVRAILDSDDELLLETLGYWATPEGLERFRNSLSTPESVPAQYQMFNSTGELNRGGLAPSAKALCRRLAENAASMRTKKVTTRHVLYALLSTDSNALLAALTSIGVDPKKEMLVTLTRELSRPGRGRLEGFILNPETVFDAVSSLFESAHELAIADGEEFVTEFHVIKAMLSRSPEELVRILPSEHQADIDRVHTFIETSGAMEIESYEVGPQLTNKEIEAEIRKAIIAQDRAIEGVMTLIKRVRFDLPPDRPAAVMLFLGPTGVGKTQMAKELARHVFGSPDKMIFLEMGQFQSKESMSSFVGAPPGYVGYGEGLLTNGLRDNPEAVVLFDEIEKAHTQVFDTLLRFADEGFISDPAGPVRDGRKCLIVMTTNAGQQWLRGHLAAKPEALLDPERLSGDLFEAAMEELRSRDFRPEFIGRLDDRITFLPLAEGACRTIVENLLKRDIDRIRDNKGVDIRISKEARKAVLDLLGREAFRRSTDEGARGAPRVINRFVVTPVIDLWSEHEEEWRRTGVLNIQVSTRGRGEEENIVLEKVG